MPQSQHLARLRTVEDRKVGSEQITMPQSQHFSQTDTLDGQDISYDLGQNLHH